MDFLLTLKISTISFTKLSKQLGRKLIFVVLTLTTSKDLSADKVIDLCKSSLAEILKLTSQLRNILKFLKCK